MSAKLLPFNNNLKTLWITDNVPLDTRPSYNPATPYSLGFEVQLDGKIYKSTADNNTGNTPGIALIKWDDTKTVVNEKSYMDGFSSTPSVNPSTTEDMVVEFTADAIGMITISGIVGNSINVKLVDKDDDSIVYLDDTKQLEVIAKEMDWWYWSLPSMESVPNIKTYAKSVNVNYNQKLIVTVTPNSNGTAIGSLNIGNTVDMGCTMIGATREIKSNSSVSRNASGNTIISSRQGYNRLNVPLYIGETFTSLDDIQRKLEEYQDKPIWLFADGTGESYALYIHGIYREIVTSIDYSHEYTMSIDSMEAIN